MTLLSWIYMIAVWTAITILNVYCFYKVFQKPKITKLDDSKNDH
ncbi:MAG: hypothetical protein NTZ09_01620 [Candidatus Hydrogenedentes bacterium]|nr:hypothetical protein [Candidatus Hydrogenedentota bacterium]